MTVYTANQWLVSENTHSLIGVFTTSEKAEIACERCRLLQNDGFRYTVESLTMNRFVDENADIIYDTNDYAPLIDSENIKVIYLCDEI